MKQFRIVMVMFVTLLFQLPNVLSAETGKSLEIDQKERSSPGFVNQDGPFYDYGLKFRLGEPKTVFWISSIYGTRLYKMRAYGEKFGLGLDNYQEPQKDNPNGITKSSYLPGCLGMAWSEFKLNFKQFSDNALEKINFQSRQIVYQFQTERQRLQRLIDYLPHAEIVRQNAYETDVEFKNKFSILPINGKVINDFSDNTKSYQIELFRF